MTLKLYNTLSRSLEPFQPLDPPHVRVYGCGPTVYDFPHIGNYRTFLVYALNGIKLSQVVNGRGVVKAGESSVGTTNVNKWRKAISSGPSTIVVNLGTNDGGPSAKDIDKFMRIAGKDRRVFWIAPFYTSCPACRAIHDYELKAAAKRFPNFTIIKVADLGLNLSSDGLHAFGKANSRAIWERIEEMVLPIAGPQPIPNAA